MAAGKKSILIILDGWGLGDGSRADVIANSNTPYYDSITKKYPYSKLSASGESVGLPEGQMGNSEVGHLNIGAGRVIYQDIVRINKAIEEGTLAQNDILIEAMDKAKESGRKLHFVGLVSDGGVHSLSTHLFALCDIARDKGLKDNVYIHAITDGRDTDPKSGAGFIKELEDHLKNSTGKIASLIGRYYSMDRDKRWERIKQGYDLMVHGKGKKAKIPFEAVKESYNDGVTDVFIKPIVFVDDNDNPLATIDEGDVVICFNFRTDRLRQMTTVLTQKDMPEHEMKTLELHYVTMTRYDESFKGVNVILTKDNVDMTMGEYLSINGKKQLRIAETEKYAHVTFFFSGGREEKFDGEERIMIPSPKVATYDKQPEMSAPEVTDKVVEAINSKKYDFICLNFANCDMVGHTGDYQAITRAVETVDQCLGRVVESVENNDYNALIIADHGNADYAMNEDGSPNTAHSTNYVPCVAVTNEFSKVKEGILADVAPTLLKMMSLDKPGKMTGRALVS
ncbi:MAG: 2,3-bisphosphoglycerate-independent phosphoglycerate mutase [Candidatus Kapaibacterium sp.]